MSSPSGDSLEENVLTRIVTKKKVRVEQLKKTAPLSEAQVLRSEAGKPMATRSFFNALDRADRLNFIAEIKKASPSKGIIREQFDPAEIAVDYESHGAAAISVLTEEDYFLGSMGQLRQVRQNVSCPILCKDFIFDPYQIYEATAAGADAVLLIVAVLNPETLVGLLELAHRLGKDVLVEVHSLRELNTALECGAKILGINNRDLKTFKVDLQTSIKLAPHVPDSILLVSESGISTADDVRRLREAGCDAFLIGEHFIKSEHPGKALRELMIRSLN